MLAACSGGGSGSTALPPGPAADASLPVPAPEHGIQLTLTNQDVPIGGEAEICQLFYLDNEEPIEIGGFEISQPLGSHHFVVYSYEGTQDAMYPEGPFPAAGCTGVGPPDSMNLTQVAGAGDEYEKVAYPPGTGIRLRRRHPILLNSHYTNSTGEPFSPTVYVNLYFAEQKIEHTLESLVASNYAIFVPPGATRTATARWRLPYDMLFILLSSHEHKRGLEFTARIVEGAVDRPEGDKVGRTYGEDTRPAGSVPAPGDFYRSDDWEHPTVLTYDEPRLFPAGTLIEFSCTQKNDRTDGRAVTFGPLSDDEMCMLTGIYYRGDGAPPMGTRIAGCLPQDSQLICGAEPVSAGDGPAVCGDGRKARAEACDRGEGNGAGGCTEACELDLREGDVLGTRVFPIVFAGPSSGTTDFLNSVINGSSVDGTLGVASDGPLRLTAGALGADGSVTVSQDATATIGIGLLGGSGSFCARIYPTANAGRVHCRGGAGTNVTSTLDNASGDALPTDLRVEIGKGDDSGPGAAGLLLSASLVSIPGAPEECLTRDWSADAVNPIPFTTGNATGRIEPANGEPGTSIVMSRDGENFDCSRWQDEGGPGVLQAMPFLAPNGAPGFGDVIAQLALAGRPPWDDEPQEPEPTPTPAPTEIGGELLAIRDEVFALRCGQASCHSDATRAGGLVLVGADVFDQLVGVLADNPAARAAGALRVVPDDPDQSFLVRKLDGDLAAGEGLPMPFGGAAIPAEEVARIRDWIAGGAPAR
jgi:hypothetical protein